MNRERDEKRAQNHRTNPSKEKKRNAEKRKARKRRRKKKNNDTQIRTAG